MKLLFALCLLLAFDGYCQEDFRLRPWSDCNDYDKQNQIVISEEGKVISFPQHIYRSTNENDGRFSKGAMFRIVDKKGKKLDYAKFKTKYIDTIKVRLESLTKLNKDLSTTDPLRAQYDSFKSAFEKSGLDFDTYVQAVNQILLGRSLDDSKFTKYRKCFPTDLPKLFHPETAAKFHQEITVKGKRMVDGTAQSGVENEFTKSYSDNTKFGSKLKPGEYAYSIKVYNPAAKLIFDQFIYFKSEAEATKVADSIKWFQEQLGLLMKYEKRLKEMTAVDSICQKGIDTIEFTINEITSKGHKNITDLVNDWKLSWIWFSGEIGMDPFMVESGVAKYTKDDLVPVEQEIKAFELLLTGISNPSSHSKLMAQYLALNEKKQTIEKTLKNQNTYSAKHKALLNANAHNATLYQGILYISAPCSRYVMRNHNAASSSYELFTKHQNAYYDYEDIRYLVHNVTDSKTLKLKTTSTPIENPSPTWVADVNSIFTGLDVAYSIEIPDALSSAPRGGSYGAVSPFISMTSAGPCGTSGTWLRGNSKKVKDLRKRIKNVRRKFDQDRFRIIPDLLWIQTMSKTTDPKPILGKTVEVESKDTYKKPAEISYEITKYKKANEVQAMYPFSKSFSHYKRRYIQIYAGVNFTRPAVTRVVINEDENPANPILESQPIQASAGLKIYPFGGVVHDNRFMAHSKHRFFLSAGLNIPKPFDHIYTGVGYDIIPGLSLHVNAQFIKTKEYVLLNGEVDSSRLVYKPAFNVGIGVDASLFVTAFKFLTK